MDWVSKLGIKIETFEREAMPLSAHPKPEGPFAHLMMDFIELTPCRGQKYCLIIVDIFFLKMDWMLYM